VKTEIKGLFEALQKKPFVLTHGHEPDTVVDDFLRHCHEPNTHVFYSRFRDKAAFGTHQRGAFHDDLVPPILGALAEETDLQFLDPIE
jgi:quinol monooxygenase YgiN